MSSTYEDGVPHIDNMPDDYVPPDLTNDWRISGLENGPALTVRIIGCVIAGIGAVTQLGLLIYFLIVKKQRVFRIEHGAIKPNPLEGLLATGFLFDAGRLVFLGLVMSNRVGYYSHHPLALAEVLESWPWGVIYAGMAKYLVGIIYLTPSDKLSHGSFSKPLWVPPAKLLNCFLIFALFVPLTVTTTFAALTGHSFDKHSWNSLRWAGRYFRAHYWSWAFFLAVLCLGIIFFAWQFNRELRSTITAVEALSQPGVEFEDDARLESMQELDKARKRVVKISIALALGVGSYAITCSVYVAITITILRSAVASTFYLVLWDIPAPLALLIVSVVLIVGVFNGDFAKRERTRPSSVGNQTVINILSSSDCSTHSLT
ncbi:hypothetical protein HDU85_007400 [Gaertneriomyces sp. JEL0708]|nr:hypothetical protein HDU85_007400 [Gaertneriomyces sp. JEL0708]